MLALTRPVPDSIGSCELTHVARAPIDLERARAQHAAYEEALSALGCEVRHIPAADQLPDSVFVEDAAIVLDEAAIVTRPGAASRREETAGIAAALIRYRPLLRIEDPATLDGGDVLRLGRTLYVGVGGRTNPDGAAQLARLANTLGYEVVPVAVGECLHLKSAVTEVAPGMLLLNPQWVSATTFSGYRVIEVDDGEPFAANVLQINDTVLCASAYDRTNARLAAAGLTIRPLDVSELAKAEAGLTCCSLIFTALEP